MSADAKPSLRASFVTPWYGPDIPGGAEAEARRTAQNLAASGVQVQVLTTCLAGLGSDWDHDHYPPGLSEEEGVRVRRFATAKRDGEVFHQLNSTIMAHEGVTPEEEHDFLANMVYSPDLLEYIAAHPEDGPFFFIPYLFTSSIWGPLVHPSRSVIIPCLHDEGYARLPGVRKAFESARAIVFHVPAERDLAASLYDLNQTEPLILGEGVDTDWSGDPQRFRERFGITDPFILYAGRKDAGKNVPLLAQFFMRYKKERPQAAGLKLVMIGNLPAPIPPGGEKEIIDLGFVSKQEKYDAYAAAAILAQPSMMESFSLVIMESWLAGVPVLVHSGCAVTKEHAEKSGAGLHFADYAHFAAELDLLLGDADLRRRMGAAGREYVLGNYSWPVVTEKFRALIQRLSNEEIPAPHSRALPRVGGPARGQAPAVHQMLADFAYGDAIGNDVVAIQKTLRAAGFHSEIFARHIHPRRARYTKLIQQYAPQARPQDVLIYHFSHGTPLADEVLDLPGRKVLRYHNITPPEFLQEAYPDAAEHSRLGRRQLARLAPAMELGMGVSEYNRQELEEAGCAQSVAVPILLDLDILSTPADPQVLERFSGPRFNVLHVGRMVPNKRVEDLIKTQYWLAKLVPGARLLLVGGGSDGTTYGGGLRKLVDDLKVPGVHFAGHVSTSQLMAYYHRSHLYMCMSEHEGFCVPLVEAMYFSRPIVAFASSAVPATLKGHGVLLEKKDPLVSAQLAARIAGDPALGRKLGDLAHQRLERFLPGRVAQELLEVLSRHLGLEPSA